MELAEDRGHIARPPRATPPVNETPPEPPLDEQPSYDLEFDRRGWRRLGPWLRTGPGICAMIALVLVLIGAWQAPNLYRAAKVWRVQRLVAQVEEAEKRGDDASETLYLRKAFTLLPAHALTWRALAHYHEHRGEPASLAAYEYLLGSSQCTLDDVTRATRTAALRATPEIAKRILALAETRPGATDLPAVRMLRARMLAAANSWDEALALAENTSQSLGGEAPEKLVFATLLLQAADRAPLAQRVPIAQRAIDVLAGLALRNDDIAVEALSSLISLARQPAAAQLLEGRDVNAWVRAAESHPKSSARLRVLAWNLQLVGQEKAGRDRFFTSFVEKWREAPLPQRLEAARWLNQNARPDLSVQISSEHKDVSQDWFLVHLDSLAALEKWDGVLDNLGAAGGQAAAMPGALRSLFMLRARKELRRPVDEADTWRDIQIQLQSEPVRTQVYVAQYAERTGDIAQAMSIYQRVINEPVTPASLDRNPPREARLAAYTGLIRHVPPNAPVGDVLPLVEALSAEFPELEEARNDAIYLKLLVAAPTAEMRAEVGRLLQRFAPLLAYRTTAALLELRAGNAVAAEKLYDGWKIDWGTAADRFKAVRAAALKATGKAEEGEALLAQVKKENLRPEEAALLR